jgi:dienelactone hydrolase
MGEVLQGRVFDDLQAGVAYAQEVGFGAIMERGRGAAERLPDGLVYAGFSLGVMPAQMLAQTRPGAQGALLFHACVLPSELGGAWPQGVPVQIHGMDADPVFAEGGDLDAARALVQSTAGAELFLYPGAQHLFADCSLPSYDEGATRLLTDRVLSFLAGVG